MPDFGQCNDKEDMNDVTMLGLDWSTDVEKKSRIYLRPLRGARSRSKTTIVLSLSDNAIAMKVKNKRITYS
jgi:hypothetical protein